MNRHASLTAAFLAAALLVSAPSRAAEFDEFDIYFELNHTDGDLGIHALLDGDPWQRLVIESPDGKEKLRIVLTGTLRKHGLTELFFESAEPPFDELPTKKFFNRFKEGVWELEAETIAGAEGEPLEGEDRLSHVMPAPAGGITLNGIPAAENCDSDPLPTVSVPVTIDWNPVTTSHPDIGKDGPIEIVRYELVLELESDDSQVFSVRLPPNITSFEFPAAFLALDHEFKFEIIAREESGNQTAIESCFLLD
jgi:hypothetical protein